MKKILLFLAVLFSGNAFAQIADGDYPVTETYKVTIAYNNFPTSTTPGAAKFTGTKTFSGTVSGSIHVQSGAFTLVDKIGFTPGQPFDADSLKRTISKNGNTYNVDGLPNRLIFTDRTKVTLPTITLKGIVFLGCFAVSVDVLQGEVIFGSPIESTFHATGPAGAIKGGGVFGGPTASADIKVETTIAFNGAKPPESTPPTVAIKSPAANAHVTTANISVNGTASDTSGIASVQLRVVNSSSGVTLFTPTGTANWNVPLILLTPGTNTITAIATDNNGNIKETSVKVVYDRAASLDLRIVGSGKIAPTLNTASLIIGKSYTINATANPGSAFSKWQVNGTDKTGSSLTFTMQEGMVISAIFTDAKAPDVSITSPKNNERVNQNEIVVQGKASDNNSIACVYLKLNDGEFMPVDGKTNWSKHLTLKAGPNTISVFSQDSANLKSKTNTITVTWVKSARLNVTASPTSAGSIAPPTLNGQLIEVGKSVSVNATAKPGFAFVRWEGSLTLSDADAKKSQLKFTMPDAEVTLVARFSDNKAPEVTISAPKAAARLPEAGVIVTGTAKDNLEGTKVYVALNQGEFSQAEGSATWQKPLTLIAGPNTIRVYAQDVAGNISKTNSITVTYVKSARLHLSAQPNGSGTIAPNMDGQLVEVGKSVSVNATAKPGFAFLRWEGTLELSEADAKKSQLKFTMPDAEVTLQAEFKDNKAPEVTISTPKAAARLAESGVTVTGTAKDNLEGTKVYVALNQGEFSQAEGSATWQKPLTLIAGPNTIRVYAKDLAGNISKTNSVTVTYVKSARLHLSAQPDGSGTIAPNMDGQLVEVGKVVSLTATAKAGFAFDRWDSVGITISEDDAKKPALKFTMPDEEVFVDADFKDNRLATIKGIYIGTFASGSTPSDKGNVGVIILSDGHGIFIGGNNFGEDSSSFSFEFMAPPNGEFSFPTEDGTVVGKITATGITGTYASTNTDNGTIEINHGSFTMSKQPDTGAQAANAGYYIGSFSTVKPDETTTGSLRALLAANGKVLFTARENSEDDSGGSGIGSISAANVFTGNVDGVTKALGTLNPSNKTISGTFKDSDNHNTTIELHRVYAPSDVFALGLAANVGTDENAPAAAVTSFIPVTTISSTTYSVGQIVAPPPPAATAILSPALTASSIDSTFIVTFAAQPGKTYTVQVSHDLANWTDLGTVTPDSSEGGFTTDLDASQAVRFYRVIAN